MALWQIQHCPCNFTDQDMVTQRGQVICLGLHSKKMVVALIPESVALDQKLWMLFAFFNGFRQLGHPQHRMDAGQTQRPLKADGLA